MSEDEDEAWQYWHARCITLEAKLYELRARIDLDGTAPWSEGFVRDVVEGIDEVLRPRWGIK